jgi:spore maturation protein CgeB
MRIAFFGSSLVSAYWNGAATYYRGIIRALATRGHRITFFEPDAYERQRHRDMADPDWCRVVVYPADERGVSRALTCARGADLCIKASGVGVFDEHIACAVAERAGGTAHTVFWDVDAPATLDAIAAEPRHHLRTLIPRFDLVLTYGGGPPVVEAYRALGAKSCVPIYNALDPETHFPVAPDPRFAADVGFLGNRLPDRERRVGDFFLEPARRLPASSFLLGGSGWESGGLPANVRALGHVYTADHNAFNSTVRMVLNVNRSSMARYGFSPPTRVFEAAGAAACVVTDAWEGIDQFLEPGREVLVARDGQEVAALVTEVHPASARAIGAAGRRRILAEHTYERRAAELDAILGPG